jgi:hypothetical protein
LGAVPEATTRWCSVVLDRAVDEGTLLQAAAYVVGQGTEEQARAVLAALAARGVAPSLLSSLEATLTGRFEDD